MRTRCLLMATAVAGLAIAAPTLAQTQQALVELNPFAACSDGCPGPFCTPAFLTDLCSGTVGGTQGAAYVDLTSFECQHITFEVLPGDCISGPVVSVPPCTNEIRSLQIVGGVDAVPSWERRPCTGSYDLIRGEIAPTFMEAPLGSVVCLANDVPQQGIGGLSPRIAGPDDSEMPPTGHVFVYLARAAGVCGASSYGRGSNGMERLPTGGDCPP